MSLLTACTEASPGVSYFAPAGGGGGGGGGSTLQSPASITPAVDGTASFSVLSTGGTLASVEIGDGAQGGQSSSLILENGAPGTSQIQMNSVIITQNAFSGAITVGNVNTGVTPFGIDTVNNVVNIGTGGGTVSINAPLTYTSAAGAPKAGFPPIVLGSTAGAFVQGDNTVALGGLAPGLYAMYGDTGGSTNQADLDSRFNSIVQINPAFTCSGGAGGSDTGWNLSPNGTGGLTLNLTNAPTGAFSVKAYPIYLF